ncbi:cytokinin dehydrogenase 3-like [Carex rostrata]
MEFIFLCSRVNVLILLLTLCSPYKFIQSPMDFGPLNLLQTTYESSRDFGRIVFNTPAAVLRPQSKTDISLLLSSLSASSLSRVTVSARGAGHSIHGQAQAVDGIVVEMESLPLEMDIHNREGKNEISFMDVSSGALWIEVLKESLKFGLAPRSWTDYLHLTVGGTLSNAGISGQTFKFGPQISNVLQLEVVTGQGEFVTCSRSENSELFYSVLGGLGQFGIITKARIILQKAPEKVKWIRAFYNDFDTFTKDQELLVSMPDSVDYVEGFKVLNEQSLHSSSVGFPGNIGFLPDFGTKEKPKVYFCIEFAVHDYQLEHINVDEVVRDISRQMSCMQAQFYSVEVSYFDFLDRVSMEEISLRKKGLWDVHHPWLNMFVPKSGIVEFKELLMEYISPDDFMGLILIYPLLRDKWDGNMSAVLPEVGSTDRFMYVVGVLQSASPDTCNHHCLHNLLQHQRLFAQTACDRIGAKQYLGHQPSPFHWRQHFSQRWDRFARRKSQFDRNYILGPGQGIFTNPQFASS